MRKKIAIANQMRISRKSFSNNLGDQKLCSKCYRTYVIECIVKRKENFKISFKGKYIQNLPKRTYYYYRYIVDRIYRFFLIHFTPNDDKTLKKYELIHFGVSRPIHFKIAVPPNEIVLYSFLEENGFKIIDEHLYRESTVYDVARA